MLSFQWMTWMTSPKAIKQLLERTSEAQLPGSMKWPWHAMAPHSFSCCAYQLLTDVFPGVLFVYLTVLARYGGMEHDCCWHQTCRKAAEEVWQDNKTSSSWVWRRQDKFCHAASFKTTRCVFSRRNYLLSKSPCRMTTMCFGMVLTCFNQQAEGLSGSGFERKNLNFTNHNPVQVSSWVACSFAHKQSWVSTKSSWKLELLLWSCGIVHFVAFSLVDAAHQVEFVHPISSNVLVSWSQTQPHEFQHRCACWFPPTLKGDCAALVFHGFPMFPFLAPGACKIAGGTLQLGVLEIQVFTLQADHLRRQRRRRW